MSEMRCSVYKCEGNFSGSKASRSVVGVTELICYPWELVMGDKFKIREEICS